MDWRLITALSAAGGAFGLLAVGAYTVMTAAPLQTKKFAPPPLLADHRVSGIPSNLSPGTVGASTNFSASINSNSAILVGPTNPNSKGFANPPIPNAGSTNITTSPNLNAAIPTAPNLDEPSLLVHSTVPSLPDGALSKTIPADNPAHPRHAVRQVHHHKQKTVVYRAASPPLTNGGPQLIPKPLGAPFDAASLPVAVPGMHYDGMPTTGEIPAVKHRLRLSPD
jgi:hypothetical protein